MVADALIYHPVVSHYQRFVATTLGRDKALRTLQYFARFLAWYTYRTNHPASTVDAFTAIKKNFSDVRKCLRLGKFVEHLKAASVAADAKPAGGAGSKEDVLKYLQVGRQMGYAVYLFLDGLAYFDQIGVWKFEGAKRVQREAYRAWMMGLACNAVAGVYSLYHMREETKKAAASSDAEKAVEVKKIEKERAAAQLQLVSDLCDLTVPTSNLGLIGFDDGFVGLAGTTSSLIGLTAQWAKTA